MSFKDPAGLRPSLTIGLALQASRNETVEVPLGRFVVVAEVLTTDDFLEKRDGGLFPIVWDDFRVAMTTRLGADGFINHRERAIDFVREYMRRLVPSMPAGEKHAAAMLKAIVKRARWLSSLSRHRELKRTIAATEARLNVRDEDVEDVRRRIEEIEFVISSTQALLAAKRAGSGLDAKEKLSVSLERRVGEIETAIQKRSGLARRIETIDIIAGIDPSDLARVRRFALAVTRLREVDGPAELISAETALLDAEQLGQRLEEARSKTQEQLLVTRKRLDELRALVGHDPSRRPADSHLETPTRRLMLALRQANMDHDRSAI